MTYADDLVILCRKGKAEEALSRLREIMGTHQWAITLIRQRGKFLGYVTAPDLPFDD